MTQNPGIEAAFARIRAEENERIAAARAAKARLWNCSCGETDNDGPACIECGEDKP